MQVSDSLSRNEGCGFTILAMFIVLFLSTLVLSAVSLNVESVTDSTRQASGKEAFITMLYTIHGDMNVDGFEIGVRVLGQSLRESKTKYDYVVLCTDDVPEKVKNVLRDDGWIVEPLKKFSFNSHFNENVYKLNIWHLTEYRRLVYIDADAIVLQNIDNLFKCGSFCATFRHSDLFNAGVMVVKPSLRELEQLKKSMKNISAVWMHKTFGDQAILNHHFKNLKSAKMFDPSVPRNQEEPMRLSSGYNSDIGIYYINNNWAIPKNDRMIIHYTLGITKPMLWWTYPLFDLNWKWDGMRSRLPTKFNEPSMFAFKHWLPPILLIILFISFRSCYGVYRYVYKHRLISKLNFLLLPGNCGWGVVFFPILIQTLSLLFASYSISPSMRPKPAWFLFGMWTMFYLVLFYSLYCRFLYEHGEKFGTRFVSVQAARMETFIHILLFLFTFFMVFYIPYLINSFHHRAVIFFSLVGTSYVQGYVSGRRVLKIWFGHNVKSVIVPPCYQLEARWMQSSPTRFFFSL